MEVGGGGTEVFVRASRDGALGKQVELDELMSVESHDGISGVIRRAREVQINKLALSDDVTPLSPWDSAESSARSHYCVLGTPQQAQTDTVFLHRA